MRRLTPRSEAGSSLGNGSNHRTRLLYLDVRWSLIIVVTFAKIALVAQRLQIFKHSLAAL